ncbi:hypothetical protein BGZ76_006821 [Entomortierella beljakovae]|nr:hypothetical protein BGZ76_006821 [Entomortierella beljakovae]
MGALAKLKENKSSPQQVIDTLRQSNNTGRPTHLEIQDMETIIRDCIKENTLEKYYDNARIAEVVKRVKSTNFENISKNWNGVNIGFARELCKLALYDIVLLVDDSYSIFSANDSRLEELIMISSVISEVAALFDDDGIDINFLHNDTHNRIRSGLEATRIIKAMEKGGDTQLGRNLRNKIINPLRSNPGAIPKPIIVFIITDGEPAGEPRDELETAIAEGAQFLESRGYPKDYISYQIAQVGNDAAATEFLDALDNNDRLGAFIDVTSRYEIEEVQFLRHGINLTPEIWLVKLLLGAIDESLDQMDEE